MTGLLLLDISVDSPTHKIFYADQRSLRGLKMKIPIFSTILNLLIFLKKSKNSTSCESFCMKFGTSALSDDAKIIKVTPNVKNKAQIMTMGLTLKAMSNCNDFGVIR